MIWNSNKEEEKIFSQQIIDIIDYIGKMTYNELINWFNNSTQSEKNQQFSKVIWAICKFLRNQEKVRK